MITQRLQGLIVSDHAIVTRAFQTPLKRWDQMLTHLPVLIPSDRAIIEVNLNGTIYAVQPLEFFAYTTGDNNRLVMVFTSLSEVNTVFFGLEWHQAFWRFSRKMITCIFPQVYFNLPLLKRLELLGYNK